MSILYILHLGVHILYTHIPCIVCTIWLHWIAGARHGSVSSPSSAHMAGFMADICFYVVRPTWQDRHQEKNSHNIHRNRAALCCQHNVARQRSAIRYNYSSNPSQIRNILHHNQHLPPPPPPALGTPVIITFHLTQSVGRSPHIVITLWDLTLSCSPKGTRPTSHLVSCESMSRTSRPWLVSQ